MRLFKSNGYNLVIRSDTAISLRLPTSLFLRQQTWQSLTTQLR